MVSLTTEHGTFEAETIRQAERDAKRAAKAAKVIADAEANDRKIAYAFAGQTAFNALSRHLAGERLSHSWIVRPEDRFFPASRDDSGRWHVRATDDGSAAIELWGYRPVAMLLSPCGRLDLLWTQDIDNPDRIYTLAVGVYDTQTACVELPDTITPESVASTE